jgi:hypothetical protein
LLVLVSQRKARQANVSMRGGHYSVRAALPTTFRYKPLLISSQFRRKSAMAHILPLPDFIGHGLCFLNWKVI